MQLHHGNGGKQITILPAPPGSPCLSAGKGSPEFWVVRVAPGRIMFEIDGVAPELAKEALTLGAAKLPIKTRFVTRIGDA